MKLKLNNIYIFSSYNLDGSVYKGKVIDMTETTIRIENLDGNFKERYKITLFRDKPIELVYDNNVEMEGRNINIYYIGSCNSSSFYTTNLT